VKPPLLLPTGLLQDRQPLKAQGLQGPKAGQLQQPARQRAEAQKTVDLR